MCISEVDDSVNGISRHDAIRMYVSTACTPRDAMSDRVGGGGELPAF